MNDENRWQHSNATNCYDAMAPYLVPQYDFLQDQMIRQSQIAWLNNPKVVDLGAGFAQRVAFVRAFDLDHIGAHIA